MTRSSINHVENYRVAEIDRSRAPKRKPQKCPLTAAADHAFHAMRRERGNPWASCWAAAKAHWAPDPSNEARQRAEAAFAKLQNGGAE